MNEGWFEGADGIKLYYRTFGKGTPLILNDGIGCDGYVWKYLIPYLEDHFQLVHWHYKGHGRSDSPARMENLSIPDLCRDLERLCLHLDLPPAVLVGHSMGVQVAYEFWHLFPNRVCALIPICGSYGHPLDTFHDNLILKTLFPYIKNALSYNPQFAQRTWSALTVSALAYQIAIRFEVNGRLVKKEDFVPYFDSIGRMNVELFLNMLGEAQEHDAKPFLPDIRVPVLIIGGEKDTFTPVWLSQEAQRLIPNADLLMVPDGSHTAPIEIPEFLNLRIEKFLRERVVPLVSKPKAKPSAAPKSKTPSPKKKKPVIAGSAPIV